jgi:hypothetical protein
MAEQYNEDALQGVRSGFPRSPSEFDDDPRISFSKLDEKYLLETDEGNEYEWDSALRRWVPVVGNIASLFPIKRFDSVLPKHLNRRQCLRSILLNEPGQILTRRLTNI